MTPSAEHIRALPKVELHTHVEGAALPTTIAGIAARNGVDIGVDDPAELYRYRDLADFLRVYDIICRSLQRPADFHEVAYEALALAAAAGVRRCEMFFSPTFAMRYGVPFADIWTGLAAGCREAEADHGIVCRMILDVDKPSGADAASELIASAAGCDRDELIGIGGDAGERDVDLAALTEPFAEARRHGLRTTMHLGEEGPASDIVTGVRTIGVERIDHGVSLLDDAELTAHVAQRRIPVTACPTSNVSIGIFDRVADHPLVRMRDAGVLVTVNADNAAMFGIDLADEYHNVAEAFGLSLVELEDLSLAGVEACWADDSTKSEMHREFLLEFERLRDEHGLPPRSDESA